MSQIASIAPDKTVWGITASKGVAIGKAQLLNHEEIHLSESKITADQADCEWKRIEEAIELIKKEIALTREIAQSTSNAEIDLIIETQLQILSDPELIDQISYHLVDLLNPADVSIWHAFQQFIDIMEQSRNEYMLQRIPDIKEIRDRLIRAVQQQQSNTNLNKASIIVADWVAPGEVVLAHQSGVKAIVCNQGGLTSHAAIIAHAMGIPMVIGLKHITRLVKEDELLIADAIEGCVILSPDDEQLQRFQDLECSQREKREKQFEIISKENTLTCGAPFTLRANLEFLEETDNVRRFGCDGIGLLRTESLLLTDGDAISEAGQERFYSQILASTDGIVTIRLFDIGGDKLPGRRQPEPNPFLGERGIRYLLSNRDILRSQLRAIVKVAQAYPNRIKLLVPMLAIIEEWLAFKEEFETVTFELGKAELKLGAMVEVPSLIVQADQFSKYVDFYSIGTNDLTQYIMATDRGNPLVANLYDPLQPAVFKGIKWMYAAAERNNKPLAVCGEAASNPFIAVALVGLGITELSMTPNSIPDVKKALTSVSLIEAQSIANQILACETVSDVREIAAIFHNHYLQS
ncbi:phosphoenolpyruvate--protein phosphotransferase [bacterium]|nr:MAG: phosphoenolpyruvate--protein phosphotransferase [bacterium]